MGRGVREWRVLGADENTVMPAVPCASPYPSLASPPILLSPSLSSHLSSSLHPLPPFLAKCPFCTSVIYLPFAVPIFLPSTLCLLPEQLSSLASYRLQPKGHP